jgi:hypothetical protein
MEFTDSELDVIRQARSAVKRSVAVRIVIFATMLIAVFSLLLGYLGERPFTYLAAVLALAAVLRPVGIGAPRYEDLVRLLESKMSGANAARRGT